MFCANLLLNDSATYVHTSNMGKVFDILKYTCTPLLYAWIFNDLELCTKFCCF